MEPLLALIIEDDKDCATLFSHIFEFVGFNTEIITEGRVGLDRLSEVVPHLISLDLNLNSKISGLDILQYIRSTEELAEVPVVVITAYPHITEGIEDLADLILIKPVSPGQLSNLVSRFYPHDINHKLMQTATIDSLTGLPNRALFLDRLGKAIERKKRHEEFNYAVIHVEAGSSGQPYSQINRNLREEIAVNVAFRLKPILRRTDTLARIGSNEFAVLIEGIKNPDDASLVAKKIQIELVPPFYSNKERVDLDVKIGVCQPQDGLETPEDFLNQESHPVQ